MAQTRTVVHLVRHGEVDNPAGLLYGRLPDYHLSELGREMARTVAEDLRGRDIVHLRCSPLERAQETMEPIAGRARAAGDHRRPGDRGGELPRGAEGVLPGAAPPAPVLVVLPQRPQADLG